MLDKIFNSAQGAASDGGLAVFHHQQHRSHGTSFVVDCSYRSYNALTPDCRRLREMFYGRETIGGNLYCAAPPQAPLPGYPNVYPVSRELYIHDTQVDMWYHCCEHRHANSKFMTDAQYPRLSKNMGLDLTGIDIMRKKKRGPDVAVEVPDGPLLQCNMMQPLKHRQAESGGRKVTRDLKPPAKGALGALAKLAIPGPLQKSIKCIGDEAVALKKYAGGTKVTIGDLTGADSGASGSCIDLGPHNRATSQGKPYAVYELSAEPLLGPLAIRLLWRNERPAAATRRTGDFL